MIQSSKDRAVALKLPPVGEISAGLVCKCAEAHTALCIKSRNVEHNFGIVVIGEVVAKQSVAHIMLEGLDPMWNPSISMLANFKMATNDVVTKGPREIGRGIGIENRVLVIPRPQVRAGPLQNLLIIIEGLRVWNRTLLANTLVASRT